MSARNTSIQEAPTAQQHPPANALDAAQRQRIYRYIMLAGGMTFTILCGLSLLVLTVTRIIPQAKRRMELTPEPALYSATLWCPPCEQAGRPVSLRGSANGGVLRGSKMGQLPHGTPVSVLAREWSALDRQYYVQIAAEGQKGWVPETLIKR